MTARELQQRQFQARLKRISSGAPNTMSQVYAGPADTNSTGKTLKLRKNRDRSDRASAGFLISLAAGLMIGAAAVTLVRYGRFRLNGGALGGPDADILMATDIVLAITLAILLRIVFRFKSRIHGVGKLFGVLATVLLMHNAVFIAPGLFEKTFSVAWVDSVMAQTEPKSLLGFPPSAPAPSAIPQR